VSVRRRPLLSTFPHAFLEVLHHSLQHVWEKLLPLLPWCSVSNLPLSLVSFRKPCSWDILRERSIATRDTCFDEYWSADEISSESRQNRCFWNTSPQQKPDALQTSAPLQLKCFWIFLEERSRTNSPRQRFHSQLFCKIVMYFCRTLYKLFVQVVYVRPNRTADTIQKSA